MSCTKCKKDKLRCGCADSALTIPTTFSNDPTVCPTDSEPCSEVFDMACICYEGEDIQELDIKKGDRFSEILQKLVVGLSFLGGVTFGDEDNCGLEPPINIVISNLESTSLDISWGAVTNVTSYIVKYKESTATVFTLNPSVTTTSDIITGLSPETVYDIRIEAVCPSTVVIESLTHVVKTPA